MQWWCLSLILAWISPPVVSAFAPWSRPSPQSTRLPSVSVPVSELEKNLEEDEKTTVSVARSRGPAVAYVTSVWARHASTTSVSSDKSNLPAGQSLGTGSGFVVDGRGYLVSNFHVIERAYQLQEAAARMDNFTSSCPFLSSTSRSAVAQVFVRVNSKTQYQAARIIDVRPELDLALLKLRSPSSEPLQSMDFGSSSDLLVGQRLIAIGNPFGLDNTVTTGVVSALGREVRTSPQNALRNCIQTDCSINPGNSGGPLLNSRGQVVGINTAIISTSGSSAGIGFAVPSDPVREAVDEMIRQDTTKAWAGFQIVRGLDKNWVSAVQAPAADAGVQPLRIRDDGSVEYGDAVVAVGGNQVIDFPSLTKELDQRRPGEQLALTLENAMGDRRVVYLAMEERPKNSEITRNMES